MKRGWCSWQEIRIQDDFAFPNQESQRDSIFQPRVAELARLPGVAGTKSTTLKELHQSQTYRSSNSISYRRNNSRNSSWNVTLR
jgi:hypothetical protein